MLIRSFAFVLIVASTFVAATGQTPNSGKDAAAKPATSVQTEKLRDVPLPGGVDLQFLVKELARDMDLNVMFDPDSRLETRKVRIDLKNVTTAQALNAILLQERLVYEESAPNTILIASEVRVRAIPQIAVGLTQLTAQLAQYFGVEGGVLINSVSPNSPGARAGLKAGDVIVGIDAEPVRVGVGLIRAVNDKNGGDFTLRIVRDRREQTVGFTGYKTLP